MLLRTFQNFENKAILPYVKTPKLSALGASSFDIVTKLSPRTKLGASLHYVRVIIIRGVASIVYWG